MKYFEEFLLNEDDAYPKCFGVRIQEGNPENRLLGYAGRKEIVLEENVTLKKGHREVLLKASKERPIKVRTMLQRLEPIGSL